MNRKLSTPVHRFEMKIPSDLWEAMERSKPNTSPMATWVKDVIARAIEVSDIVDRTIENRTVGQHVQTIQKDGEWG